MSYACRAGNLSCVGTTRFNAEYNSVQIDQDYSGGARMDVSIGLMIDVVWLVGWLVEGRLQIQQLSPALFNDVRRLA